MRVDGTLLLKPPTPPPLMKEGRNKQDTKQKTAVHWVPSAPSYAIREGWRDVLRRPPLPSFVRLCTRPCGSGRVVLFTTSLLVLIAVRLV